jgi:hypothetical protein
MLDAARNLNHKRDGTDFEQGADSHVRFCRQRQLTLSHLYWHQNRPSSRENMTVVIVAYILHTQQHE